MPAPNSTSAATSWRWPRAAATRSNGTASARAEAGARATGCARRATRSRAGLARFSSTSSRSIFSGCRTHEKISLSPSWGGAWREEVVIALYIADFACRIPRMLVVEVDGDTHAVEKAYRRQDRFL